MPFVHSIYLHSIMKMSTVSLLISHTAIHDIEKSRYFKHYLIAKEPFIYSRMAGNTIVDDKINGEFLKFLRNLNKPIYFVTGELKHRQGELDFALQLLNENDLKNCKTLNDDLLILPNQFYGV